MKTAVSSQKQLLPLLIGLAGYSLQGMGVSLLGVAWPAIRDSFGLPLDAVGWLLLVFTIGHLLSSLSNGRMLNVLPLGSALIVGVLTTGVGMGLIAIAPRWALLIIFFFIAGAGTGIVNPALNTRIAATGSPGLMNWLHASFGIGATLGPIVVTALITNDLSWRLAYALVAGLQALIGLAFWYTHAFWTLPEAHPSNTTTGRKSIAVSFRATLSRPLTWLSILIFFLYTGLEASTGQWAFVLFTEGRGVGEAVAGAWVSAFWAVMTGGRLLASALTHRLGITRVIRLSTVTVVVGTLLLWQHPGGRSLYTLAIIGAGLATIFPLLMTATPQRLGRAHAANAIGFQTAAAGLGASILPGLVGIIADNISLETIGPFLLATAVALLFTHEAILRREAKSRNRNAPDS